MSTFAISRWTSKLLISGVWSTRFVTWIIIYIPSDFNTKKKMLKSWLKALSEGLCPPVVLLSMKFKWSTKLLSVAAANQRNLFFNFFYFLMRWLSFYREPGGVFSEWPVRRGKGPQCDCVYTVGTYQYAKYTSNPLPNTHTHTQIPGWTNKRLMK